MKRFLFIVMIIGSCLCISIAQENHFSQFYNTPQLMNPAFAGDAHYMRLGLSSRILRPLPTKAILNNLIHFDYKLINHASGIGFTLYSHNEALNHTKLQFNYSYTFQLSRKSWVKGGIGLSFNQRGSGYQTPKFPDQYDILGYTGNPTSEPSLKYNTYFPGLTTGFIFYDDISWISFSGDYLNLPNQNFAGLKSRYPIKLSVATGFLYPLNKNKSSKRRFSEFGGLKPYSSVGPVFCYVQHGKYTEISSGISTTIQPFYGGIHYRYQHDFRLDDTKYAHKAIVFLVGYRQEEFTVSYSFDTSLSNNTVNKNGAHEFSFTWHFSSTKEEHNRLAKVPLPNQLLY